MIGILVQLPIRHLELFNGSETYARISLTTGLCQHLVVENGGTRGICEFDQHIVSAAPIIMKMKTILTSIVISAILVVLIHAQLATSEIEKILIENRISIVNTRFHSGSVTYNFKFPLKNEPFTLIIMSFPNAKSSGEEYGKRSSMIPSMGKNAPFSVGQETAWGTLFGQFQVAARSGRFVVTMNGPVDTSPGLVEELLRKIILTFPSEAGAFNAS